MNAQISRYNENGSENLDYWFGVRSSRVQINLVSQKPQYVRYTMENLKKRSTRRLNKMHYSLFGTLTDRKSMIENLFSKLNYLWSEYRDFFKGTFFGSSNTESTGKRGRKPKFNENQVWNMVQAYHCGMKLKEIAEMFNTNIATVSQTVNGKGTYGYIVNTRLIVRVH